MTHGLFGMLLSVLALCQIGNPVTQAIPATAAISTASNFINMSSIRHVICGNFTGTGEIIDRDTVLTAAHVAVTQQCYDDQTGALGEVIHRDTVLDIAVIRFQPLRLPTRPIPYSCEGFKDQHIYFGIGWQHGIDLVVNRLVGTSEIIDLPIRKTTIIYPHVAVLIGSIIPGMSGGPIVDENGVMIGMNQATNGTQLGFSRSLSDTYLCQTVKSDVPEVK